ncbi:hypothetical protein [Chromobacterium sp. CV08]|uniref:hypothetical protein n=1 Tax=Chromobacterium sp. CV08 TaxID=3133274 RepID=UPI003DAA3D5B
MKKIFYATAFLVACSQYAAAQNEDKSKLLLDQCYYTYSDGKIVESKCTTEPLAVEAVNQVKSSLSYNAAAGSPMTTSNPQAISLEVMRWTLSGQPHCHVLNTAINRQALLRFIRSSTSLASVAKTVGDSSIRLNAQGDTCDMVFLNYKPS